MSCSPFHSIRILGLRCLHVAASVAALFAVPPSVRGQSCTDVYLTTQDQVDSFSCTVVTGSLEISGNEIWNLDGLAILTSVGRNLRIFDCSSLQNINGLSNLSSVGWSLLIHADAIEDVDALAGLTDVGAIGISAAAMLQNLDGLSGLTSPLDALSVFDNPRLSSIGGLSGIPSVGGDLIVQGNNLLTNVGGLSGITSVGGNLNLSNNQWQTSALTNIDGLSSLVSVGRSLTLVNNPQLMNLNGLSNLTTVARDLIIADNPVLQDIDGLSSLTSVGTNIVSVLRIAGNSSLRDLDGLVNITSIGGNHEGRLEIENNEQLANIDGLSRLGTCWKLVVEDNLSLANVNGLTGLTGSDLTYVTLARNDALIDVDGLARLTWIGGELEIVENDQLMNLDGLSGLVYLGNVTIVDNEMLSMCCGLYELLSGPHGPPPGGGLYSVVISGNAPGCESEIDLLLECGFDPVCDAGGPYSGCCYELVDFDATGSQCPGCTYEWDFGDGHTAVGETTSHMYTDPGDYTVTLTLYGTETCESIAAIDCHTDERSLPLPCSCPDGCSNPMSYLEDAADNRLEVHCLGGYYALVYKPSGGEQRFVGKCPWWGGRNINHVKFTDCDRNGEPDRFVESYWQSRDTSCDDYPPHDSDPWDLVDWARYYYHPSTNDVRVLHIGYPRAAGGARVLRDETVQAPSSLGFGALYPSELSSRCAPPGDGLDDGPMGPDDGALVIRGMAEGGSVVLRVTSDSVTVMTSPGQAAESIASDLAAAVNGHAGMQSQGFLAQAIDSNLTVTGVDRSLLALCVDDLGVDAVPPVQNLTATLVDSALVLIEWENPGEVAYDEIYVSVDRATVGHHLLGTVEAILDTIPRFPGAVYSVVAYAEDVASCATLVVAADPASDVHESMEDHSRTHNVGPVIPNPFGPSTQMSFELPRAERVLVQVHDTAGRVVCTVHDGLMEAGNHTVKWDGRNAAGRVMPAGVYYLHLASEHMSETQRAVLIR